MRLAWADVRDAEGEGEASVSAPTVAPVPVAANVATPGTGRLQLAFCDKCGALCAEIPRFGWRHLLISTDDPSGIPCIEFQADGTACDPGRVAQL